MKTRLALLLAASTALTIIPASPKETPAAGTKAVKIGSFGFDEKGMDKTVSPGEDFYRYANGTWAKATSIPADKSNYGMFTALDDLSKDRLKTILDAARADPSSKVGIAYAAFLDEATVESRGFAPIKPWLDKVRALKDKSGYAALAAEADRSGIGLPFAGYVGQDDKNPDVYIYGMSQAGLGMPDRDFYILDNDRMKAMRAAYAVHLGKTLTLAGERNVEARAQALLAFETQIARVSWTREDSGDATKIYNKMTFAELQTRAPGFDFTTFANGIGAGKSPGVLVAQPSAFTSIAALIGKADIGVLRDQMIVRSLDGFSDVLPKAITDEAFAFFGTTLNGTPQNQLRWKRGVDFTTGALGDEISTTYVARYYPPETKAKMDELVTNVLAAMGRRIDTIDWMQPVTKVKARQKLANFTTKIGYPERWRDYAGLEVRAGDAFGNALRSRHFQHEYNVGKLGQPIYRWEWAMTPMTVNAYANFGMNEIVFPAAILQPPFFDPNADSAINYGGIGSVIGHEISHHFDDQGAKYDQTGKLADWWTAEDVKNFEARGKKLIAQYDAYEVFPGEKVKGEFTLGENIGDLAGVAIAYDAWKASLKGKPAPVINGMTGDQRFFLGWAQVWRRNYRDANLRQRLLTDPHSPSKERVAVVRNFDAWNKAFATKPGQKLYLKPEERVKIW